MKKLILSLSLLIYIACGRPPIPPHQVDPFFLPLISRYKEEIKNRGVDAGDFFSITVFKISDSLISKDGQKEKGECETFYLTQSTPFSKTTRISYKAINLSKEVLYMSTNAMYQLFLHEIGHCAYNLLHTDSLSSIMYPYFVEIPDEEIEQSKDEFFEEVQKNKDQWFKDTST